MFVVNTETESNRHIKIEVPKDTFDCGALICLCDNSSVILKRGVPFNECDVAEVLFFLRTYKHNHVVVNKSGNALFTVSVNAEHEMPNGMTLNDYVLLSAKDLLLNRIYTLADRRLIAFNCMPTPFGVTEYKGLNTAVFQIVCLEENLPPLNHDFEYQDIDSIDCDGRFKDLFRRVKLQFVKTHNEEENNNGNIR